MFQLSWWDPVLPWWQRESSRGRQRSWTDKLPPYCTVRDQFWIRTWLVPLHPSHTGSGESLAACSLTCNCALEAIRSSQRARVCSQWLGIFLAAWGSVLETAEGKHRAVDLGGSLQAALSNRRTHWRNRTQAQLSVPLGRGCMSKQLSSPFSSHFSTGCVCAETN